MLTAVRGPRMHASRTMAWGFVLIGLAVAAGAGAQERKAYKYVDEKGNVVYSSTPPLVGKDAKQIDIAPAYRGIGGSLSDAPYDNPRHYSTDRQDRYAEKMRERKKKVEEARQKRRTALEAECNHNRGDDCKNPETLRLIESNKRPGGRRYPPGARRQDSTK